MEGECCPHSGGECGYEGIGFRSEHRSNDSCETTDVLDPVPEPIAGSVLSPLSAEERCSMWNPQTLSGIPELIGRTQEHFACRYFAIYPEPPGILHGEHFARSLGGFESPFTTSSICAGMQVLPFRLHPGYFVLPPWSSVRIQVYDLHRRSLLLVGVAQDIGGPPAIGHCRIPYDAFAISARWVVAHTNDFRCFRVATAIS